MKFLAKMLKDMRFETKYYSQFIEFDFDYNGFSEITIERSKLPACPSIV